MLNLKLRVLVLLLFCSPIVFGAWRVLAATRPDVVSPVNVSIKVEKKVVEAGKPIDGKVVIMNKTPVNFPATFDIQIFHNEQLVSSLFTSLQAVPQGSTKFSFKHFGIPAFTSEPDALGKWRIVILQRGADESGAAEVTIKVVPRK